MQFAGATELRSLDEGKYIPGIRSIEEGLSLPITEIRVERQLPQFVKTSMPRFQVYNLNDDYKEQGKRLMALEVDLPLRGLFLMGGEVVAMWLAPLPRHRHQFERLP